MPKAFFIDTTRCTACRGCQVACKEWHELPANATLQTGTHQNPPDLNPYNFKLVRFSEFRRDDGAVAWNFFPDQCRHCVNPPCKDVADGYVKGAVIQDAATGAVIYTELTKKLKPEQFDEMREACPFNIPRRDAKSGLVAKCDMCIDRVQNNLVPMCVKTCCTGTMNFGERAEMQKLAAERLVEVKKEFPEANLVDTDFGSVFFLLAYDSKKIWEYAEGKTPAPLSRQELLAKLAAPVRSLLRG